METALDKELINYILQLDDAEKKSVLTMLKTFLKNRIIQDKPINIEQYNKELEESEAQIEAGKFTTQEELEKEMEQW